MNKLLLISVMFLTSCASLTNFQEQPVVQYRDAKTYKTTCNGMAEDWGSCFRKASRTCSNNYEVIEKTQDSFGLHRDFTFSCK